VAARLQPDEWRWIARVALSARLPPHEQVKFERDIAGLVADGKPLVEALRTALDRLGVSISWSALMPVGEDRAATAGLGGGMRHRPAHRG
jgi:hypothetical protein